MNERDASSSDDEPEAPAKRQRADLTAPSPLLPPPPLDDDDDLAAGSIIQHHCSMFVEGTYSTHVSIPVLASSRLKKALRNCVIGLEKLCGNGAIHEMDTADLHMSLSRTVSLRRPQLEAFKDAFENVLALLEAVAAVATPRVDAR